MKKLFSVLAALSLVFSPVTPGFAKTRQWIGVSIPSDKMSDTWNWLWWKKPSSGDSIEFSTRINVRKEAQNDFSNYTFSGISFTGSARDTWVYGNGIKLDGDIENYSEKSEQAIDWDMALQDNVNFYSGAGSYNLRLDGVISGGYGISKDGTSTLTLGGANTYTGVTTITQGTLTLDAAGTIASSAGVVNNATFAIQGNKTIGYLSGTGSTTLGANTLTVTDTGTYSGVASGTGGLTINGTGKTLTLTGANTYTGATTISAGTLQIGNNGTTGSLSTSSAITNNGTLSFNRINAVTQGTHFASVISGSGGVTQAGSGTLTLSGANTYAGVTSITRGTLTLNATGTIASSSGVSNAGTFTIQGNKTIGYLSGAGSTQLGNNTLTVTGTGTYSGVMSGTGGLTLNGAGKTLTLQGANTYSGTTSLTAGTLALGNNLALQNSTLDTSGSGVINATGFTTPTFGGLTGSKNLASVITTGYGSITGITLNPGSGVTDTYSGVIADGAAGMTLTKTGAGVQTLSGANTYTGATTVHAGTLTLDYSSQNNSKVSETAALILGGGTIHLSGGTYEQTVASTTLSAGDSSVTRTLGTAVLQMNTITVNPGATIDFSAENIAKTNNDNTTDGYLGTWATIGGTDWAMKDAGAGVNGFIVAFEGYEDIAAYGSTINGGDYQVRINSQGSGGDITLGSDPTAIDSLLQNTSYDATVDIAGQTFRADGIMIGEGKGALTIGAVAGDGSTLTSSTAGAGIDLINYSNSSDLTINAVIANNGGVSALTKAGDGVLTLNGINTYTGATNVDGGTLNLNEDLQNLSPSSGLIFGADAKVNLASGKDIECVVTTDEDGTGTLNFLGGVQSAGGDIGAAGLALKKVDVAAGSTTTFNGDLYTTTLSFSGDGTANIASDKSITGAVDNLTGSDGAGTLSLLGGDQTVSGNIGATNTLKAVNIAAALTKTAELDGTVEAATITMSGAGKAQFDGAVTATALNVTSSGEVEINADSSITTTTVNTGTLDLNATFTGTTLTFTGAGEVVVADEKNITVNITNTSGLNGAGTLTTEGESLVTGTVGGSGANQRFGSLNINGAADTTARITGAVYATTATIGAGTLQLDSDSNITTTNLTNTGTLALNAVLAGAVNNGGNLLTVSSTGTGQIDGVISNLGGLTKTGSGTLTLSGVNTYSGGTNINAGVVSATASAEALGTGAVVVADDAALQITGALTFNEALTITGAGVAGAGALRHISGNTIYSGVITLGGDARINSDADLLTLSGATIDDAYDLAIGGDGNTTISGIIAIGDNTLVKDGAGTLTLSGVNTYSGGTNINAGVVDAMTSDEALGTGDVAVADGAALQIRGALDFNEALTIIGTGVSGGGALRHISGNTTYSGDITLGSAARINSDADLLTLSGATIDDAYDLTIGGAGDTHVSGVIAVGDNTLTKDGAGTLTLSGANTYTGATTISSGTLQIGNNGTTGSLSTSSSITNNGTLSFYRTNTITQGTDFASIISGTGAVRQEGSGTLILNGANTYSGGTTILGGTLNIGHATALGSGRFTINGGTINTNGANITLTTNNTQTWNASFTFTGTNNLNLGTGAVTLAFSPNVTVSANTLTIGGAISGAYGLTKLGAGALTLSGANAYTGGTTLTTGTLNINHATALGTGAVAINGGTIDNTSGSSKTLTTTGAQTWGGDFTFTGTNSLNLGTGAVTLGTDRQITVSANALTIGGAIGDGGNNYSLTKAGDGTLVLDGVNTHGGGTHVTGGTLKIGAGATLSGTFLASSVSSGGTLDLNGSTLSTANEVLGIAGNGYGGGGALRSSVGGSTWNGHNIYLTADARINSDAGTFTIGAGARELQTQGFTVTIGGAGDTAINRVISGTGNITKDGVGTLLLSGTNTYTGTTTVTEGVLELDFSAAGTATDIIKNSSALVLSGGELLLTGKNATVNSQTVNGLTLNSGKSEITLTANGATSLVLNLGNITNNAGATVNFTLPTGTQDATNGITTTRTNDASGILGAWATVTTATGTEWAVSGAPGGGASGNITAYAGYTNINVYGGVILDNAANNVRIQNGGVAGNITLQDSDTKANTLMQDSDFVGTVDTAGGILRTYGIMISSGAADLVIGDVTGAAGTLTTASNGGDLVLSVQDADSILTVNSVIANNGAASALIKSGDGTATLNGVNTYTGATTVSEGTLALNTSLTESSGLSFSDTGTTVTVADGKDIGRAGNVINITTTDNDQGTLTLLGSGTIFGQVGAAGAYLAAINAGAADETTTFKNDVYATEINADGTASFDGDVNATTLNLASNSTAVIASGKDLTGEVKAFHGKGTLTLSGGNQAMTGDIGTAAQSWLGTIDVAGAGPGTATFNGAIMTKYFNVTGSRDVVFNDDVTTLNDFTLSSDSVVTLADTKNMTLGSGGIAGGSGEGTLTLLGTHTITGNLGSTLLGNNGLKLLTVGDAAGTGGKTVTVNGDIRAVTVNFAKDNELKLGSGYGITGAITTTTSGTGTLTFLGDAGAVGAIGAAGKVLEAVNFNGATTLSNDIYATDSNVQNGGTLTPGGGDINGNLSLLAGGTLSLGSNLMQVVGGAFSSAATSGINVSISSGANGKIEATGAAASVDVGTSLFINVVGHIPENNQFTVLDGGAGGGVGTLTSITDDSERFYFTQVADANDLILLSNRYTTFSAAGANLSPNARAVGAVFDAIDEAGATGDMLNVIDTLDTLSNAQIGDAFNTMTPDVSSGSAEGSRALTGQAFSMVSNRLGGMRTGGAVGAGVSTGEMLNGVGVWMQGLGSHMKQGERKGIQGYKANLFGTTIGADKVLDSHFRAGFAGSYGWARVKSKEGGSPSDDINSYQATIYGSFDSLDLCKARQGGKKSYEAVRSQVENSWYVDGMFAFTQNNYDSRREIWVTPASARVAKAEHYGQQYSTNFETGYKFVFEKTKSLEVTPFVGLGYNYLYMNKYKEKGADALNLTVEGEGFQQLEQSLGTKLAYPMVSKKMGTFIPSVKAAWLYDYIGDRFQTTATFAGGGPSFDTIGAKPARNGMLFGTELAFLNKGNMTLTGNWDLEVKDQFASNTYYGTARFDF
jgi:autotransporter-associated beta strand protein